MWTPPLIQSLLDGGYIPVIATVGMDDLGQAYNINADTAAARIAVALQAEKVGLHDRHRRSFAG